MGLKHKRFYDKVDLKNTANYSDVPSGSNFTSCNTFFNTNRDSGIYTEAKCHRKYELTDLSSYEDKWKKHDFCTSTLHHTELVSKLHNHYWTLFDDFHQLYYNFPSSLPFSSLCKFRLSSQKLSNLPYTKTLFLLFVLFAISLFSADGAPVLKRNISKPPSLTIETNLTSVTSHIENSEIMTHENVDSETVETSLKIPSIKIKRSVKERKRPKKAGKRKKGKKNKKLRRKQSSKKKRKRKKSRQTSTSISTELIHHHQSGHPTSTRRERLYNKNGLSFHLAIWKNGSISGEESVTRSEYSILEIRAVGKGGIVTIMGAATKHYICVTKKGVVKTRKKYKESRCRFMERIVSNKQNTYESLSCKGCFLNINKKGRVRKLKDANPNLVHAHFLPLITQGSRRHPNYLPAKRGKIVAINFGDFNGTEAEKEKLLSAVLPNTHNSNDFENEQEESNIVIKPNLRKTNMVSGKKSSHFKKQRKGKRLHQKSSSSLKDLKPTKKKKANVEASKSEG